ncbi:S-adenosyl-L-methionine-dependent methyltransferase [Xylaria curta]|nr:S-adenosyl-L-methionine-dependent methyltransferase [Xylaria curta]
MEICSASGTRLKIAEDTPIEEESATIGKRLKNLSERLKNGLISFKVVPALADIIDLTDDTPDIKRQSETRTDRNPPLPPNALKPGSTISFLHIKHIYSTADGIKIRGTALTRLKNLPMILHVDNDDERADEVQSAIEVPITDVIKIRNFMGIFETPAELEQQGVLMYSTTRNAHINQTRKNAAPQEYVIEHLSAKDEIKKRFKVGGKVRGGEHNPGDDGSQGLVVQLDGEEDPELLMIEKRPGQKYTFGDMFSGAGGASCGAEKGGFHVKVACDHHPGATKTYAEAFPDALLYMMDIFELINSNIKIRVDALHISPPCQVWSPAHTCAGVNDDANIAALFCCGELIRKIRPRILTLEQTFGILHPQFEYYFNALVQFFTENSYSVRWKIVDLVDWGSPATRKRLIMIGSCPGEDLPPFPEATHVGSGIDKRGKKPHVTVSKMLAKIPRDASQYDEMHQPHEMVRKRLPRWDPDVTLKRCITTNGGYGNYHPNGRRDFTLREYATLQTFPVDYPFQAPDKKKQIGNAFPPLVVKVLYTHLRKWLEKQDRVYAIENEYIDPDDPNIEIIDLEDDGLMDEDSDDEDIEYVDSQYVPSSSISGGSIHEDDMDLDTSDGDYIPVPCVDANQRQRQRDRSTIPTGCWRGNTQDCIDLTVDDD